MNLPSSCPKCNNPLSAFLVAKIHDHILWYVSFFQNYVSLISYHKPSITLNLPLTSIPSNSYFFIICNSSSVRSPSLNNFDVQINKSCYYHSFYLKNNSLFPNKECFNLPEISCIVQFDHPQNSSHIWISHLDQIHMLNLPNTYPDWLKPNMSEQVLKKLKNLLVWS